MKNKYHSYNQGNLPKGCQYCVRGEKLVLFVTGLCPRNCYFCPLSDKKLGKDVIFANELKVDSVKDLVQEAKNMNAKGMGITGGDPLVKLDRTIEYIKEMKKEFGKHFHIHLYTSLNLVNEETLKKLFDAGLDEIRFHLDFDDKKFWKNLELAKKFSWDTGVEVPLIPSKEKESKEMVDFVQDKVDFLNLNELEVADNAASKLIEMGFEVKDDLSYAVAGSLELGIKLLAYVEDKKYDLPVHLCTAKLKDSVQLANRIKREAEVVKHKFDLVDKEGMLTRGALYLPELKPGFSYREKLEEVDKDLMIDKLDPLIERVKKKLKLGDDDIYFDRVKLRLLVAKKVAKKNVVKIKNLGLVPAIVVEYPTADQLEVEVDFLE